MSIRCKDSNKAVVMEAFRRAQYKVSSRRRARRGSQSSRAVADVPLPSQFPGRQKIIVSKKWG